MTRARRFIENETSGLMRKPGASFPPVGFYPIRMRPVFVTVKTIEKTPKATPASKGAITVKPYAVTVPWVEITVPIPDTWAKSLASRSEIVSHRYGSDICRLATDVWRIRRFSQKQGLPLPCPSALREMVKPERGEFGSSINFEESMTGRRLVPLTFSLKASEWESVLEACKDLDLPTDRFVRGALLYRLAELREFDRRHPAA